MHCYCLVQFNKYWPDFWQVFTIPFGEGDSLEYPCEDWMFMNSAQMTIALTALLVNWVLAEILEKLKQCERRETKGDTTLNMTYKQTFLQFVSIGILVQIVN